MQWYTCCRFYELVSAVWCYRFRFQNCQLYEKCGINRDKFKRIEYIKWKTRRIFIQKTMIKIRIKYLNSSSKQHIFPFDPIMRTYLIISHFKVFSVYYYTLYYTNVIQMQNYKQILKKKIISIVKILDLYILIYVFPTKSLIFLRLVQ